MTEREEFVDWFQSYLDTVEEIYTIDEFAWLTWQARGKQDAERIAEWEADYKKQSELVTSQGIRLMQQEDDLAEYERNAKAYEDIIGHKSYRQVAEENKALSLQIQVLRDALFFIREGATGLYGDELIKCNKALNSTPNPEEWIRKSDMIETASIIRKEYNGSTLQTSDDFNVVDLDMLVETKLYRVRGKQND